jgi:hypothetical protein
VMQHREHGAAHYTESKERLHIVCDGYNLMPLDPAEVAERDRSSCVVH